MGREYSIGQTVIYVDPIGHRRKALVTDWFGQAESSRKQWGEAGCNVVFVSDDIIKSDSYGRQIQRAVSLTHKSKQVAPANYWCWPDEA